MRLLGTIIVLSALVCPLAYGQTNSTTGGTTAPAVAKPATTPAATTPAAPAAPARQAGPAEQKFLQQLDNLTKYGQKFNELQTEYKDATPERQQAIAKEAQTMIETFQKMEAPLVEAAKVAYKEAPDQNKTVSDFLIRNILMKIEFDDYENALREADALIRLGMKTPAIYEFAGYAAFNAGSFDYAEKVLQYAQTKGTLSDPSQMCMKQMAYYKAAWVKESAARKANTEKKDCPIVVMKTDVGDMTIELFANEAPNTVANFLELVEKGFYNGLTFHRVIASFMAQGGCPLGNGTGGPGYSIPCEVDNPMARKHFRGSLSMAHAGKDTGGSQFFLTFVPTQHLDGKHTVFGRVIKGLDVLAKIQKVDPQAMYGPQPTKIEKVEVLYKPAKALPAVTKLPEKK